MAYSGVLTYAWRDQRSTIEAGAKIIESQNETIAELEEELEYAKKQARREGAKSRGWL